MRTTTYNWPMVGAFRLSAIAILSFALLALPVSEAQSRKAAPANPAGGEAERALSLAESGHCVEAMALLKKTIRQTADKDRKKRLGLTGLQCAMTHNAPYDSLQFLDVLVREFPGDPDVLYAATHAFSDLSLRTSQDLMHQAPFSFQVHQLNAEALELQGRWDEAATEYHKILEINPLLPGIHARLGRVLLSKPQPSPAEVEQAKKNFEQELHIDPNNAVAEYVLGDLAQRAEDSPAAIRHFSRATQLDSSFAEAYLGLGSSLVSAKRFQDAIAPLEAYEKLAPDSPTGHYQLALAYTGVGRKNDANREAALQRQSAESLEQVKRNVAEGLEQQKSPEPAGQTPVPPPQ